jgi:hypothetical protein
MDYQQIFKQMLLSSLVSLLIFLMINVAFAQLITSTILQAIDGNTALTTIVFLGFLVASIVAIVVNLLISESYQKLRVFYAACFSLLCNLVVWISISYFFVLQTYPGLFPDVETGSLFGDVISRGGVYFFSIPRMVAYFSIYIIANITLFWIYTVLSYALFYSIFLFLFGGSK